MPNLKPPITTTAAAISYRESILKAVPANGNFTPLMTLYLTDTTDPDEIKLASKSISLFNMVSRCPLICFKCRKPLPSSSHSLFSLFEAFALIAFILFIHSFRIIEQLKLNKRLLLSFI